MYSKSNRFFGTKRGEYIPKVSSKYLIKLKETWSDLQKACFFDEEQNNIEIDNGLNEQNQCNNDSLKPLDIIKLSIFLTLLITFVPIQDYRYLKICIIITLSNNMNKISISRLQQLYQTSKTLTALNLEYQKLGYKKILIDLNVDIILQANKVNAIAISKKTNSLIQKSSENNTYFDNGELKIFLWVVTVSCQIKGIQVKQLIDNHLEYIRSFFPCRSLLFIKYKLINIIHKSSRKWTEEEEKLLVSCVDKHYKPKWGDVSFEIFVKSGGTCFKSFSQCRQRWNNHLDPSVKRSKWTDEDDYQLLQEALTNNFVWSEVYLQLKKKRTQHMIRNRFRSLERYFKKLFEQSNIRNIVKKGLTYLQIKMSSTIIKKKQQIKEGRVENTLQNKQQIQLAMFNEKGITLMQENTQKENHVQQRDHIQVCSNEEICKKPFEGGNIFCYEGNDQKEMIFCQSFLDIQDMLDLNNLQRRLEKEQNRREIDGEEDW